MTYKDALMEIVKSDDVAQVIVIACPADTPNSNCPKYADNNEEMSCIDCWNREMPEEDDHVIPGTARRWIKRNLWRLILALLLFAAGAVILAAVAATREASWAIGGEIVPASACWALAARVAAGEQDPRGRR